MIEERKSFYTQISSNDELKGFRASYLSMSFFETVGFSCSIGMVYYLLQQNSAMIMNLGYVGLIFQGLHFLTAAYFYTHDNAEHNKEMNLPHDFNGISSIATGALIFTGLASVYFGKTDFALKMLATASVSSGLIELMLLGGLVTDIACNKESFKEEMGNNFAQIFKPICGFAQDKELDF